MYPHRKDEIKVKVATRQDVVPNNAALVGGLLLFVILSVVVLVGRPAGFM